IPLVRVFVFFPGATAKETRPIVRWSTVFALPPVIVVPVLGMTLPAFYKPGMLVRSVIDDKVHDDLNATLTGFGNQALHVFHRTILGIYVSIVADIVSIVIIWAFVNRRQPYDIYAQILYVIQLGYYTRYISYS